MEDGKQESETSGNLIDLRIFRETIRRNNIRRHEFDISKSIQEDQMELFQQIEDNISAMGVDGHACILRFICEMQTNRFSASSIFGEIFSLMFTPKQGDDYTLLKEYIEAEMAGVEGSQRCSERYLTCPVSVFSALRNLSGGLLGGFSTPQDKPLNSTFPSSGVSYLQDSLPWMENHL
ncbi:uncharacterized protein LOC125038619 [Penaeus chinensis]|uniref:uncharacterized protein LOC125038619 n=1 Tax=Penaeus chinensis TaxID=139456 RepID=UPI001FB82E37|nr:uncharacterized protein LOC125038619 [Penaeus chinensis]